MTLGNGCVRPSPARGAGSAAFALHAWPNRATRLASTGCVPQGSATLLTTLALLASLFGGLAKGPWWFWLVGGGAIAILSVTDPTRRRAPDTDFFGAGTLPPPIGDLKTISAGW